MNQTSRSRKSIARRAGVLYLLMAITAAFSLMYIPSKILVQGDASATLQNLLAQESMVRWVIVSHFVCHSIFLVLVMTLYKLFKGIENHTAWMMVLFVAVQVPLIFVAETFSYTVLMIAKGELMQSLQAAQKADFVLLFLKLRSTCFLSAQVFWGLWLIPLGRLAFASGFMPRILGGLLIAGGIAYLMQTSAYLLVPEQFSTITSVMYPVHTIAEVSMILWLCSIGTNDKKHLPTPHPI
jgi:hypothetical protein